MDDEQIWQQQPGEPARWYARFELFRLAGPDRSLLGSVHTEEANCSRDKRSARVPGAWDQAARKWRWRERAEAWDASRQELVRKEEEAAFTLRRKVWLSQSQALQSKAAERLLLLKPEEMSVRDMIACFVEGVKLERLAMGQPDTTVQSDGVISIEVVPPAVMPAMPSAAPLNEQTLIS